MNMARDIDAYTQQYLKHPFLEENVKYRRRLVLEQMSKYEHNSILEIGCGMWPIFAYLRESEYEKYTVVEPSETFYNNAKNMAHTEKINVMNGLFEQLSDEVAKHEYDFIICSSLLHEVDNPKKFLTEVKKCCNSKTIVHINVPNSNSLHRLIAYEMGIIRNKESISNSNLKLQQKGPYSMEQLIDEIFDAGFTVDDKGSFFLKPFSHSQMQMLLDNDIIGENVIDGLYKVTKYFPEYGSEIYVNAKVLL